MNESNIKDRIIEHTILIIITAAVGAVIGWLAHNAFDFFTELGSPLLETIIKYGSKKLLIKTILVLVIILIGLSFYVLILYRKLKATKKLKPFCGVLWDHALTPHCPNCKSVLVNYDNSSVMVLPGRSKYQLPARSTFDCLKCKNKVELKNIHGAAVPLSLVLEDLKKRNI